MNDMGRMQQDRAQRSRGGRGRVEMHSDAGGVRRAGGRLPAGVQQNST
jgi:hypothetical protein